MQRKNSPQYVINSYQKRSKVGPIILWAIAGIIFGAGIVLLVIGFSNGSGGSIDLLAPVKGFFASPTPTATETFTPTPTVPTSTPTMTPTETETPTPTLTPTPEGPQMYTVEEGDNCWSIAVDKFGVDFELFMMINNMTACNIGIGDQVVIPARDQEKPTMTPIPLDQYTTGQIVSYVVEMNDSYNDIAAKFSTTLESIQRLNNVNVYTTFPQYGQVLQIEVNLVTPTPAPEATATPEVATLQP